MLSRIDLMLLEEFKSGKILTTPVAYKLGYGHYLPSRVYRLRRAGYAINSWPGDEGYFKYSLSPKNRVMDDFFMQRQLCLDI
jgi:hypothetical protein